MREEPQQDRSNHFANLRRWYRQVFWRKEVHGEEGNLTPEAKRVLKELSLFCRADRSCVVFDKQGQVDTHATAVLEGRREVWLKIVQTLHITDQQLTEVANAKVSYDSSEFK